MLDLFSGIADRVGSLLTLLLQFATQQWEVLLGSFLGLAAIYFLFPRPRRFPTALGAALGTAALAVLCGFIIRVSTVSFEGLLFYLFSAVAILGGVFLVTQQNPARAALSFALVVMSTCGLFLIQAAPFLFAATVIVYAGAIIVTFLFVLMLAQQQGQSDADARSREPLFSAITGFLLLATLLFLLKLTYKPELDRWVEKTKTQLALVKEYQARQTSGPAPTEQDLSALASQVGGFVQEYKQWWNGEFGRAPRGGKELSEALLNLEIQALPRASLDKNAPYRPADLALLEQELTNLYEAGKATRNNPLLGNLRASNRSGRDEQMADQLSEMSGPRASRELEELRRDEWGRPKMPAKNTAYLGKSLFTDYLLAVEMAGMLLLVATVGAIAIANRRPAGKAKEQR